MVVAQVVASNQEQSGAAVPAVPAVDNDLLSDFAVAVRAHQETVFWQSIQDSTEPADFEVFFGWVSEWHFRRPGPGPAGSPTGVRDGSDRRRGASSARRGVSGLR